MAPLLRTMLKPKQFLVETGFVVTRLTANVLPFYKLTIFAITISTTK